MSLDKFDYVLALAEERNLTRAAKKTFISQPALTNYINKLESQLGVKLFDRTVSPIQITRAGALYIERMKKIQMAETACSASCRALGAQETVFHFGIGATRGSHWLPFLIPEFCRRHPEVALQLHEHGEAFLEDGVRRGEIDLAFGALNTSYLELPVKSWPTSRCCWRCPESFPASVHCLPRRVRRNRRCCWTRRRSVSFPSCCPTRATVSTAVPRCFWPRLGLNLGGS